MKKSLIALIATAALALTACSTSTSTSTDAGGDTGTSPAVTVTDAWVKAVDDGMTGAFGIVTNETDADVTIVSAATDAAAMVQLHETVVDASGATAMQEVDGGFTIPAGGTLTLEPGGNHLMLMDVADPLQPGDQVTVTLTLSDGSTVPFDAVVKEFTGAQESYAPSMDGMDHGSASPSSDVPSSGADGS
ncbi:copper chaperone PCu(A)C [Demequina capsici]|uniref:Copper chaperone PCu(A)C n=1 Tax=Demequina capsici TaxID=3075620 RepID=A0AA96FF81_9MICO|nr:copper chaperone PCu(A)C [Demequina sp. PMTSA13]WNM27476.1 copper chaperone PCu(A)C [Demequina sp. PMTSA13]